MSIEQSSNENFLAVSDEEFLKLPEPVEEVVAPTEEAQIPANEVIQENVVPTPENTLPTDEPQEPTDVEPKSVEVPAEDTPTEPTDAIDYKAFYEQITGGFTANGTKVSVSNPDEIISLMQKGCGYTRKMQELVPVRAATELLKQHNLLDPDKLGFLIELNNGNPTAIAKLVKDHNIDVFSQEDNLASYKPTPATPNEQSVIIQDTFDNLSNSEHYAKLCQSINSFDEGSKGLLAQEPKLITQLHNQMATGIYDHVYSAMTVERAKGNFAGLSDLEAYMEMGDLLLKQNKLPVIQEAPKQIPTPVKKPTIDPAIIEQRRKAAAPTGSSKPTSNPTPNYLAMSDEEFAKLSIPSV